MSEAGPRYWLGRPRHLSFLYGSFMGSRPGSNEELLAKFAAKLGMDSAELEETFRAEELEHEAKECTLPGCLEEFEREHRRWGRRGSQPPPNPPTGGWRTGNRVKSFGMNALELERFPGNLEPDAK